MKQYEKELKVLANQRRLEIIKFLKIKKEATVGAIANNIKLSFKATSKHLGIMYSIDILEKEQRSTSCFYKISQKPPKITKTILSVL